jgi:molybdenum cofactor guanylyltransferase
MVGRAALVLSGGSARRFQTQTAGWQDKALAETDGKPLLVRAVENVHEVVDEVIVCVNNEERKAKYLEILGKHGLDVHFAVDRKAEISGPAVGIMSGLHASKADYCLAVPCDMPFLKAEVADCLFAQADGFEVSVPMWPDGRLETLNMTIQREVGLEITQTLSSLNRSRVDDIIRASAKTLLVSPLKEIKKFDPDLKSFVNINAQEDLKKLPIRHIRGPVKENVQLSTRVRTVSDLKLLRDGAGLLKKGDFSGAEKTFDLAKIGFEVDSGFFWTALAGERKGEALLKLLAPSEQTEPEKAAKIEAEIKSAFAGAVKSYQFEAAIYEKNRCSFLFERALSDKAWCESKVTGKPLQPSTVE